MSCKHEKIKSVNCEIFCMECGEKLPIDYLVAKRRIVEQKSAEKPVADVPADDNTVTDETPVKSPENGEKPVADVPAFNDTVVAKTPAETPENGENGDAEKPVAEKPKQERKPKENKPATVKAKGGRK